MKYYITEDDMIEGFQEGDLADIQIFIFLDHVVGHLEAAKRQIEQCYENCLMKIAGS